MVIIFNTYNRGHFSILLFRCSDSGDSEEDEEAAGRVDEVLASEACRGFSLVLNKTTML